MGGVEEHRLSPVTLGMRPYDPWQDPCNAGDATI